MLAPAFTWVFCLLFGSVFHDVSELSPRSPRTGTIPCHHALTTFPALPALPSLSTNHTQQQTRPCHVGSRCTSVSDGIYAELSFDLDLGFRSRSGSTVAEDAAYYEDRWRLRVGDALAEAVAGVLPKPCGVLPGDVAVSVLPAAPEAVADDQGGPPPRQLETVVTSVHFWRSEEKEEEEENPEERDVGVALAMGGGGSVDQARCVSALAEPSVAFDVAAIAARELSLAGRKASTAAATWETEARGVGDEGGGDGEGAGEGRRSLGDVAALAERMSVVAEGRLAVRNAPSGHRVIDLATSARQGGKNAREANWLDPARAAAAAGGGVLRKGGGSGGGGVAFDDDSSFMNGRAGPSAGMSSMLAFGMQAGGIVALGVLLVLVQRLRGSSSSSSRGSRDGGGGGGVGRRKMGSGLPTPPVGKYGADEEGGLHHGGAFDKGKYEA